MINKLNQYDEILERIKDADLVLIGCGEEFGYDWTKLQEDKIYSGLMDIIPDEETSLISYTQKYFIEQNTDEKLLSAYNRLAELLLDKNYFVVSLGIDDTIYSSKLNPERIVTPCGGFRKMQCPNNCSNALFDSNEEVLKEIPHMVKKMQPIIIEKKDVCPVCGSELVFNQVGNGRYCEEDYLPQWNLYMKWLQGAMNRKVCMLELGAGMQFPSIIRWPFEKLALYNQKAYLYRIHSSLYQVGEEIKERACGIACDSKDFILGD